jgi:hypothetical protein
MNCIYCKSHNVEFDCADDGKGNSAEWFTCKDCGREFDYLDIRDRGEPIIEPLVVGELYIIPPEIQAKIRRLKSLLGEARDSVEFKSELLSANGPTYKKLSQLLADIDKELI